LFFSPLQGHSFELRMPFAAIVPKQSLSFDVLLLDVPNRSGTLDMLFTSCQPLTKSLHIDLVFFQKVPA